MDYKEYAATLGLEEDEFTELAELFLDTCVGDLKKLDAALERVDAADVARAAHSIKGASGNLGFMDLSAVAKEIEHNARQGNLDGAPEKVTLLKDKLTELGKSIRQG